MKKKETKTLIESHRTCAWAKAQHLHVLEVLTSRALQRYRE